MLLNSEFGVLVLVENTRNPLDEYDKVILGFLRGRARFSRRFWRKVLAGATLGRDKSVP